MAPKAAAACKHVRQDRQGSNQYQGRVQCKDCGAVVAQVGTAASPEQVAKLPVARDLLEAASSKGPDVSTMAELTEANRRIARLERELEAEKARVISLEADMRVSVMDTIARESVHARALREKDELARTLAAERRELRDTWCVVASASAPPRGIEREDKWTQIPDMPFATSGG